MRIYILFICMLTSFHAQAMPVKKIFISQNSENHTLDSTTKGIIDGLEKNGFKRGKNLDILLEFPNINPDIVVGVGTIAAQSFIKYANDNKAKLLFSSVQDPIATGLVRDLAKPGGNISGVSNLVELKVQLGIFQQIQPNLKKLGFLYNPDDPNALGILKQLKKLCPDAGIQLLSQAIGQDVDKLFHKVDAIFTNDDDAVEVEKIIQSANKHKIPVYVSDTSFVKLGALAALGPRPYEVGLQTGAMIARILDGQEIGSTPVEFPAFPDKTDLYINKVVADALGMQIYTYLLVSANHVVEK